jgi:2-keto-4-pentenoate hydratase
MKLTSKNIFQHRKDGRVMSLDSISQCCDINSQDAYSVQREVIAELGLVVAGWKLGGTSIKPGKEGHSISWGPLFYQRIFFHDATVSDLMLLGAEVELAVKLSDSFSLESFIGEGASYLSRFISEVAVAIELPCSVFPLSLASKNHLVSDLCASGYVVLSESVRFEEFNAADFQFELFVDQELQFSGDISPLFDDIDKVVDLFIRASSAVEGFRADAGQWVVTGALSPLVKIKSGQLLRLESTLFNSLFVTTL